MEHSTHIRQELEQISKLLASIEKKNFYSVPDGYFERNAETLQNIAAIETRAALPDVKAMYAVPEGYFAGFSELLLQKIRKEEAANELEHFALLATLEKRNFYAVPNGYFEGFYARLQQRILLQERRHRPSLLKRWNQNLNTVLDRIEAVIFKPATAWVTASLLGVAMITSVFFYGTPEISATAELESLSEQEISQYIAMNSDEFDEEHLITRNTNAIDVVGGFENNDDTNARLENYIIRETDAETIKEILD
ncbi:MAG: hypothetical protein U0T73_07615 [Chitinophagales bacterium]